MEDCAKFELVVLEKKNTEYVRSYMGVSTHMRNIEKMIGKKNVFIGERDFDPNYEQGIHEWESRDKDMLAYSKLYPNLIFAIHVIWCIDGSEGLYYYRNGVTKNCDAYIDIFLEGIKKVGL